MQDGTVSYVVTSVVALVGVLGAVPGVAAAAESGGELLAPTGWAAVALLLVGTVVLMLSVEVLVHALVRTVVRFRVSAFLLAVVFSGIEFDNVAFGVFTGFREMQDVAFGLAIGNAVSVFGLALALGAVLFPFDVEVPDDYLLLLVGTPLVLVPFLLAGSFTAAGGGLLVLAFVAVFAYLVRRERETDRTFLQSEEVMEAVTVADGQAEGGGRLPAAVGRLTDSAWLWPAVMVLALGGVVGGAELSSAGAEGVMATWNLTGTFLGITVLTLLYTVDDLLLIVEPLRLGYTSIAVGGVIGSLLFFVTANVGLVALVGDITVTPPTLYFHFPVLLGACALSAYFLRDGRMSRGRGLVLAGLYVAYLAVNVRYLSGLPIEG